MATSQLSQLNVDLDASTTSLPSSIFSPVPPMLQAANAVAFMERTPFAIDDAKDDDEESEDGSEFEDGVMDEVGHSVSTILSVFHI